MKRIAIMMLVFPLLFVLSVRLFGHRWPEIHVNHYEYFRLYAPGISKNGVTLCPEGCLFSEAVDEPATMDGKRVDVVYKEVLKTPRFCTEVLLEDYRGEYSTGATVLYDSCEKVKREIGPNGY